MPDATIVIEKVWKSDPKEGDYGTYFKYDVQYAGGGKARYVTFKDELGEKATASIGRKVLVTFEAPTQEGRNPKITAISDPLDDTVAPSASSNGSGNTKMAEAPETRAGISASVALEHAVAYTPAPDDTRDVLAIADSFYEWLMSKVDAVAPEKPSGNATGASATEGQIKEIAELLVVLEKAQPASPDPTWTWTNEAQKYCTANFQKDSLVALTKAEASQLREHLEERIAAIQVEAGIPF